MNIIIIIIALITCGIAAYGYGYDEGIEKRRELGTKRAEVLREMQQLNDLMGGKK